MSGEVSDATLLYTQKPCGCLVLVMVNEPDLLAFCRNDIAKELRAGRTLHESTNANLPPHTCAEHKGIRYTQGKPLFGHPETAR